MGLNWESFKYSNIVPIKIKGILIQGQKIYTFLPIPEKLCVTFHE